MTKISEHYSASIRLIRLSVCHVTFLMTTFLPCLLHTKVSPKWPQHSPKDLPKTTGSQMEAGRKQSGMRRRNVNRNASASTRRSYCIAPPCSFGGVRAKTTWRAAAHALALFKHHFLPSLSSLSSLRLFTFSPPSQVSTASTF